MTEAQQRLLDLLKDKGPQPVRGSQLRVAENLARQGRVVMGAQGQPWSKGWSVTAEHVDDYMQRITDDLNAEEAAREAAKIGSAEEAINGPH